MMLEPLLDQIPSLGIAGLLFVMWWYERQERGRAGRVAQQASWHAGQVTEINDHLLDVIRTNTAALTALREELRSQRATEIEWFGRLSRQLERLDET
ncbi:MAG: hypothetical protein JXO22_10205 [Phycisphaerae bacterium]|nr:hypothetical protein [Phycisphaerae bacterium]